ncbi:hypothetical protein VPH35_008233 [Triticum aestivum]
MDGCRAEVRRADGKSARRTGSGGALDGCRGERPQGEEELRRSNSSLLSPCPKSYPSRLQFSKNIDHNLICPLLDPLLPRIESLQFQNSNQCTIIILNNHMIQSQPPWMLCSSIFKSPQFHQAP